MATICPICGGNKTLVCPECKGEGKVPRNKNLNLGFDWEFKECPKCNGLRKIICPTCNGRGRI